VAITVVGGFAVHSGYASMNEYLVLGLHRAGARLSLQPHDLDLAGCSAELLRVWARSRPHVDGPVLYASWLRADVDCFAGTELFLRSMYEASRLPRGWTERLNLARAVIAPTPFVADTFRESGVSVPVEAVPDGIDPAAYPLLRRPDRAGITTLIVSAVYNRVYRLPGIADRKHLPEAIAAWQQAFAGDRTARLVLKCAFGRRDDFPADPRIELVSAAEPTRGIAHWYAEADVLLALGSEGFGLPLIEGMATGLPVIALASEGQAEICRQIPELVLAVEPAGWEVHRHEGREPAGVRGYPAVSDVAARLRWVAEHRDEAAAMGRAASAWVHRNRNVWSYGPAVLDIIERYTSFRRGVRRPDAPPAAVSPETTPAWTSAGVVPRPRAGRAGRSERPAPAVPPGGPPA
jgi:glycosyltransferase involved in cell wall biosynthesis